MRELKFRVWDKHLKIFVNLNIGGLRSDYSLDDYLDDTFNDPISVFEVQQYTGLKDKNGKEIYEGDIIKLFNDNLHKVEFIEESNEVEMSGYFFSSFGCEVIGNIFENPELLEYERDKIQSI